MKNVEKDKHQGLRIDTETHDKLKDLAEYEGRSIGCTSSFITSRIKWNK